MNYRIFLVNAEGVRASLPVCGTDSPSMAGSIGRKMFTRFVVLNARGIQILASDERDSTGAYLPYGGQEC